MCSSDLATNHTAFGPVLQALALLRPDAWVADIWNVGGIDQVFYRAGALRGGEGGAA